MAVLIDDLVMCRQVSTLLGGKYMGAEHAEEYGRRNGVPGEFVVRILTDPRPWISGGGRLMDGSAS